MAALDPDARAWILGTHGSKGKPSPAPLTAGPDPGCVLFWLMPTSRPGEGSRRWLGAPEDRSDRPRGTRRPLTRCLRLSGGSGALWRDGDPFAAPARPLRDRESIGALSSALSNVAPPRRASSPPWPPRQRNPDRLCQSGTQRPHLCTRGCAALRAGSATFAELNLAAGEGDVASDDADVWR